MKSKDPISSVPITILGLANNPDLIKAAQQGLDSHGFGVASVRFICGTQDIHKELEQKISGFLGTEDDHFVFLLF